MTTQDHTLPLSGGWVLITRELPTEIKPPPLSIFYALPDRLFPKGWHTAGPTSFWHGFEDDDGGRLMSQSIMTLLWRSRNGGRLLPHEKHEIRRVLKQELDQRVRILTPDGDVWVEPYEWVPVPDVSPYFQAVDGEHVKLHMLGGFKVAGNMADQVFYMQSRGLTLVECYRAILGEVRRPNVCWLELHESYAEFFLGRRERKRTVREPMRVEIREVGDGDHAGAG